MKSQFIFCIMLFVTSLTSVAFADEEIGPAEDRIRAIVKDVRRIEKDIKGMCGSYNRARQFYIDFNSPHGENPMDTWRDTAELQVRQERAGSAVTASYQAGLAAIPSGFNAFSCNGNYPINLGTVEVHDGKIIKLNIVDGKVATQMELNDKNTYPVTFTVSRGDSKISGTKESANAQSILNSATLTFLKFDPSTNTYNSPDGKYSFARNELLIFLNLIEPRQGFVRTNAAGDKKRYMTSLDAFDYMSQPEFQSDFMSVLIDYMQIISSRTKR